MNGTEKERLGALLRESLPQAGGRELESDLWPQMLRRMDRPPARWSWFDLVCASLAAAAFCTFPEAIPWILFCL